MIGCNHKEEETTTSGTITIVGDDSFSHIIEDQLQTFKAQYKDVHITPVYQPEEDAIAFFLKDSARLAFVTRNLYPAEIKKLEDIKIFPKTNHVATDAIALIVHPDNPDSLLTEKQIKAILEGEHKDWKQLSSKNKAGKFDTTHFLDLVGTCRDTRSGSYVGKLLHNNKLSLMGF